jgi:NTE family protein
LGFSKVKILRGGFQAWEKAGFPLGKKAQAAEKNIPERKAKSKHNTGNQKKSINLALQGGGTHGAFTWGVLDRLLEDDRVHIEAISGTSAGAMNGVIVADGLMEAGKEGARQALDRFWQAVSDTAQFSPLKRTPVDVLAGNWRVSDNLCK